MIQGHRSSHETLRPCEPGSHTVGGSPLYNSILFYYINIILYYSMLYFIYYSISYILYYIIYMIIVYNLCHLEHTHVYTRIYIHMLFIIMRITWGTPQACLFTYDSWNDPPSPVGFLLASQCRVEPHPNTRNGHALCCRSVANGPWGPMG